MIAALMILAYLTGAASGALVLAAVLVTGTIRRGREEAHR